MPTLHDDGYRSEIQKRLRALRPDSQRRWGKMSVEQMLWHINQALEGALGKISVPPQKSPLPRSIMKFLVLNLPWPKGAPTLPMFVATGEHDFETERGRCVQLIDEFAARRLEGEWPPNPVFGRVSGQDVTRLQTKHVNHHLTQFGV
jgi:DinB superfamily